MNYLHWACFSGVVGPFLRLAIDHSFGPPWLAHLGLLGLAIDFGIAPLWAG